MPMTAVPPSWSRRRAEATAAYLNEHVEPAYTVRKGRWRWQVVRAERDLYQQALIDIAGLENWEDRRAGAIAREALGREASDEIGR